METVAAFLLIAPCSGKVLGSCVGWKPHVKHSFQETLDYQSQPCGCVEKFHVELACCHVHWALASSLTQAHVRYARCAYTIAISIIGLPTGNEHESQYLMYRKEYRTALVSGTVAEQMVGSSELQAG